LKVNELGLAEIGANRIFAALCTPGARDRIELGDYPRQVGCRSRDRWHHDLSRGL
jgi:hypothetical protein